MATKKNTKNKVATAYAGKTDKELSKSFAKLNTEYELVMSKGKLASGDRQPLRRERARLLTETNNNN